MQKYSLKNAQQDLPLVHSTDNKTRGGKCLIIAGSTGMWGAAILSAEACARVGAGYVYLEPLDKKFPTTKHPNFLLNNQKNFSSFQSIAIGPGGKIRRKNGKKTNPIGKWIKKALTHPHVVLDAEALNYLAKHKIPLPLTWILTPHEGELSRLLKVPSATIRKNRKKYVKEAQDKFGCIVVLKGHRTLVAGSDCIFEIQSGNASLAKAGTGDVLTGLIAGLLSQGLDPLQAAALGVFIHGYTADQWIKKNDVLSLMATDLIENLPAALKKIRKK